MTIMNANESLTLGEALPLEIARVQEMIPEYEAAPMGFIAAGLMKSDIAKAHKAMMEGDLPTMIEAYKDLKEYDY